MKVRKKGASSQYDEDDEDERGRTSKLDGGRFKIFKIQGRFHSNFTKYKGDGGEYYV